MNKTVIDNLTGEVFHTTVSDEEMERIENNGMFRRMKYESVIEYLIRKKYSVGAEFAVLRQREAKPDEYEEYYTYCENCKSKAKEIKGIEDEATDN